MRPGKTLVSALASPMVHTPTASASAQPVRHADPQAQTTGVRNRFELDPHVIRSCSKIMWVLQDTGPLQISAYLGFLQVREAYGLRGGSVGLFSVSVSTPSLQAPPPTTEQLSFLEQVDPEPPQIGLLVVQYTFD